MATNKASKSTVKTFSNMFDGDVLSWGEAQDLAVRIVNDKIIWTEVVGDTDVPDEKFVLDGVVYSGTRVGTLGSVNRDDTDVVEQIRENIELIINQELTEYNALDYLEDLTKNSFKANSKRYGIRPLTKSPTGTIGRELLQLEYEVILSTDYINKSGTDLAQRNSGKELRDKIELIRRKLGNKGTKAGTFGNARIVREQFEPEIEYLTEDKVAICKLSFKVEIKLNR